MVTACGGLELRSLDWWQSEHLSGKSFRRKFIDNISSMEYREKHVRFSVILGFRPKLIMTSFVILVSLTLYESIIPILEIITDQAMYVKAFLKGLKGVLCTQILMFGPCECGLILRPLFYFYKPNINWEQGPLSLVSLMFYQLFFSFSAYLSYIIDIGQKFFLRSHLIFPC